MRYLSISSMCDEVLLECRTGHPEKAGSDRPTQEMCAEADAAPENLV